MKRIEWIAPIALAIAVWATPASAAPWEPDPAIAEAPAPVTWIPVEARNHVSGSNGLAAVLFGVARERGPSRMASLRVDCFDGQTTVRLDADGLSPGPWAVEVRYRLDGGRFAVGAWRPGADRSGLELSGDLAVQFAGELYGKTDLRLAVVRPLSVPFLFTFAVNGADRSLRPLAERCQWSAGPSVSDAGR